MIYSRKILRTSIYLFSFTFDCQSRDNNPNFCLFSNWTTTQEPSADDSPFVVPPVLEHAYQKPSPKAVKNESCEKLLTITVSSSPTSGLTCTAGSNVHSSRGTKSSRDHRGPSRGGGVVGQGGDMMLHFIQVSQIVSSCFYHHRISGRGELWLCPKVRWVWFWATAAGAFGHVVVPSIFGQ